MSAVQRRMIPFRRRLAERSTDLLAWVDHRRDANFWPFLALPPMLSVAWAYGGEIGLGILVAFALGTTLLVGLAAALGMIVWLLGGAIRDLVPIRPASRRPASDRLSASRR